MTSDTNSHVLVCSVYNAAQLRMRQTINKFQLYLGYLLMFNILPAINILFKNHSNGFPDLIRCKEKCRANSLKRFIESWMSNVTNFRQVKLTNGLAWKGDTTLLAQQYGIYLHATQCLNLQCLHGKNLIAIYRGLFFEHAFRTQIFSSDSPMWRSMTVRCK